MKALVIGITGFVGQYLTEHLVAAGDDVVGTAYRDAWSDDLAPDVRDRVPVVEWNLTEPPPESLWNLARAQGIDCIYHLAGISVPGECGEAAPSPLAARINVGGTRAVLELARALPTAPRVLVVSSSHVYAPVAPERPVVTESAPLGPRNAYGVTKRQAEELCQAALEAGQDVVVARAFQHAGPRQLPKFMLPEWAEQFARSGDEPIRVTTLDSHTDLSDVRDIVRAYRLLLATPNTRGIFNVGSGRNVRSGDVFQRLVAMTGRCAGVVERQPGFRQHPIADCARLREATGWQLTIPLDQTIADTLNYFRHRV